MTKLKTLVGLLGAVVGVVAIAAVGAAPASASSAPIVIPYAKACLGPTCDGTAGDGGTLHMDVSGLRATGDAAHLTLTETIKVGDISFKAEMSGTFTPDGFIVLNGTVTEGSHAGAQVHQRSNLVGVDGDRTLWIGQLQLMPASA